MPPIILNGKIDRQKCAEFTKVARRIFGFFSQNSDNPNCTEQLLTLGLIFCVYFPWVVLNLIVSTSAVACLRRLGPEMTNFCSVRK